MGLLHTSRPVAPTLTSQIGTKMHARFAKQTNTIVFGALILVMLGIGAVTWQRLQAGRAAQALTQSSQVILDHLKDLNLQLRMAESGQRGFLITGDETYLRPYLGALGRLRALQSDLRQLLSKNPDEQQRMESLSTTIAAKLNELADTIALRRNAGLAAAANLVETGIGLDAMRSAESIMSVINTEERALMRSRTAEVETRRNWASWLVLAGTFITIIALLAAIPIVNEAWSVAARSKAEAEALRTGLRLSLDRHADGMAVFSTDFRLVDYNDRFPAAFGLPDTALHRGMSYAALSERLAGQGIQLEPAAGAPNQLQAGRRLDIRTTQGADGGFMVAVGGTIP